MLYKARSIPSSRTHHSEKPAHGHFGGQALTFGAFTRFDPEKRGWLGPGLKTLKPRSFFRGVKAGARLSLLRGAAGGDFWAVTRAITAVGKRRLSQPRTTKIFGPLNAASSGFF